jgi:hypothetical protein
MPLERAPTRDSFERMCKRISREQYAGVYAPTRSDYDTYRHYTWKSATELYTESAWEARMFTLLGLPIAPVHRMSDAMLASIAEAEAEFQDSLPSGMQAILRGRTYRADGVIEERCELR